ncbi:MAG: hypothetical protein WEE36_11120 [Acidimicrobiia bacterium]
MIRPAITIGVLVVVTTVACGGAPEAVPSTGPEPNPSIQTIDCRTNSPECPPVIVEGDSEFRLPNGSESPIHGFADPSIRADPGGDRLWMAYSWPHLHLHGGQELTIGVETHLAYSDDQGERWIFDSVLWPSMATASPDGRDGFVDYEVPNLLPVNSPQGTTWYAARLEYFVPQEGFDPGEWTRTFRIGVLAAPSPQALTEAEPALLGSAVTDPDWGIDTDLSALDPQVSACAMWNEPALYWEDGRLYLVLRCLFFPRGSVDPDLTRSDLVVFATDAAGDPPDWHWEFVGTLAGAAEAAELGGEGLTQADIARGRDGSLLAILTPDSWEPSRGDFIHHGCRVVEIESMAEPALARHADGSLVLRATTSASDAGILGPAACAYEPEASIGLLQTHRTKTDDRLVATINATGITI